MAYIIAAIFLAAAGSVVFTVIMAIVSAVH